MEKDYSNWYVIQTLSGNEEKLVSYINHLAKEQFQLYLPLKKMIYRIKGNHVITTKPLFAGYIFIYKEVEKLERIIAQKTKPPFFFKILKSEQKYLRVHDYEMKYIFDMTGNKGIVELSEAKIKLGDIVKITKGPLKDLDAKILFINKRKNKAKVQINFLNNIVDVSLGIDFI